MAQQRIGRYEILEEIASGGQATVYRARDAALDSTVALKVLHPHLARDPQHLQRFVREARAARAVSHPNVVVIHEVDEENHYIAMEDLPRSLDDLLRGEGTPGTVYAVALVLQVASALQAAHDRAIVHRDLKPSNILLTEDGIPKVGDFGIARMADFSTMTDTGTVMGTLPYMSPEQARGERVDLRADLYSLGIVLCQLLTGQAPLAGTTQNEFLSHHAAHRETPLALLDRSGLPERLKGIARRAVAAEREDRFQTAQEFALALEGAERETGIRQAGVAAAAASIETQPRPPTEPGVTESGQAALGSRPSPMLTGIGEALRRRPKTVLATASSVLAFGIVWFALGAGVACNGFLGFPLTSDRGCDSEQGASVVIKL